MRKSLSMQSYVIKPPKNLIDFFACLVGIKIVQNRSRESLFRVSFKKRFKKPFYIFLLRFKGGYFKHNFHLNDFKFKNRKRLLYRKNLRPSEHPDGCLEQNYIKA